MQIMQTDKLTCFFLKVTSTSIADLMHQDPLLVFYPNTGTDTDNVASVHLSQLLGPFLGKNLAICITLQGLQFKIYCNMLQYSKQDDILLLFNLVLEKLSLNRSKPTYV